MPQNDANGDAQLIGTTTRYGGGWKR